MLRGALQTCAITLGFCYAVAASANTFIETSWEPRRSREGEPVRFSIIVKTNNTDYIRKPDFPTAMTDWDIVRTYASPSMRTRYTNGQMSVQQENEYTYILAPKRKGTLKIPSVGVSVGSKRHQTAAAVIEVDNVPLGAGTRGAIPQPRQAPRAQTPDPLWGPGVGGLPREEEGLSPDSTYNFSIPGEGRQTFFLKAHTSKTNVFLGEMIEVSYRAYLKTRQLREAEITKFPEFKGFLKEDLFFPKTFNPKPVLIQGESFFEVELIRYALYPIKEGSLKIDPMNFRVEISNRDSLVDSLLYGTPFGGHSPGIPMEKSSPSVAVLVKPLPIPKPDSFTGAVGPFKMEVIAPPKTAKTNQPFSMIINIEGVGNVKAIEPPKVMFPKGLEVTNIATHPGALQENGFATIQFEYLLNPVDVGEINIPESEWSYFDPAKAQYAKLKIPPATVSVSPGAANPGVSGESAAPAVPRVWTPSVLDESDKSPRSVSEIAEPMWFGSHTAFGIHLSFLAGLLGAVWRRRSRSDREEHLKRFPWTSLEESFLANQKFSGPKLAEKLDLWTRLRLLGYFKAIGVEHHLHSESSRQDFLDTIKLHLPADFLKTMDVLKSYWSELDSMRFTGTATSAELASKVPFEKAQSTLKQIEKSLRKTDQKYHQSFQDEWTGQ